MDVMNGQTSRLATHNEVRTRVAHLLPTELYLHSGARDAEVLCNVSHLFMTVLTHSSQGVLIRDFQNPVLQKVIYRVFYKGDKSLAHLVADLYQIYFPDVVTNIPFWAQVPFHGLFMCALAVRFNLVVVNGIVLTSP